MDNFPKGLQLKVFFIQKKSQRLLANIFYFELFFVKKSNVLRCTICGRMTSSEMNI